MVNYDTEFLKILAEDPNQMLTIKELATLLIEARLQVGELTKERDLWKKLPHAATVDRIDLNALYRADEQTIRNMDRLVSELKDILAKAAVAMETAECHGQHEDCIRCERIRWIQSKIGKRSSGLCCPECNVASGSHSSECSIFKSIIKRFPVVPCPSCGMAFQPAGSQDAICRECERA